jgi:hypothetical protein
VTNSVETRPLTVGLGIFGAPESGVDWSIISTATLMSVAPLLIALLLFQRNSFYFIILNSCTARHPQFVIRYAEGGSFAIRYAAVYYLIKPSRQTV